MKTRRNQTDWTRWLHIRKNTEWLKLPKHIKRKGKEEAEEEIPVSQRFFQGKTGKPNWKTERTPKYPNSPNISSKSHQCHTEQGVPTYIKWYAAHYGAERGKDTAKWQHSILLALIITPFGKSTSMQPIFQSTFFHNWIQNSREESPSLGVCKYLWNPLPECLIFDLLFH